MKIRVRVCGQREGDRGERGTSERRKRERERRKKRGQKEDTRRLG